MRYIGLHLAEMIAAIRGLGCVAADAQLGNRVGFAASMGKGSTVLGAVGTSGTGPTGRGYEP